MASVNVVNCPVGIVTQVTGLPSMLDADYESATLTSSGTSSTIGFEAAGHGSNGGAWIITVTGGSVYVKFGPTNDNPTATNQDILILDGQTREFWARPGDTVAIIDAA